MVKRILDISCAACGLLLLSPVMLLIAAVIAMDSSGGVIFRQQRFGKFNRTFTIYKYRTMIVGTPTLPTDQLSNPHRYITRVGRILRKTSLDELPQLWNIIIGDMSLVGPRPALYNQQLLVDLRTRQNVHTVRPGLTGWAQINGRDDVTDEEKVALDAYYCEHRSLILDIHIVLRTFRVVSTAKGVRT